MDCKTHPGFFEHKYGKRIYQEDKTTLKCSECGREYEPDVLEEHERVCCGRPMVWKKRWIRICQICGVVK